jgi:hypothetical protein
MTETTICFPNLDKMKKVELQVICRQLSIPITGTKQMLIERIKNPPSAPAAGVKKPMRIKRITPQVPKVPNVLNKLLTNAPLFSICRNKHNQYEHPDTGFVFNEKKEVFGRQMEDGSVAPLTEEDVEVCKEYKFAHVFNL